VGEVIGRPGFFSFGQVAGTLVILFPSKLFDSFPLLFEMTKTRYSRLRVSRAIRFGALFGTLLQFIFVPAIDAS